MSTVFDQLVKTIDAATNTYVTTTASNLAVGLKPAVASILGLYIVLYGYKVWMGEAKEPLPDFITRMIKIFIILGVALSVLTFQSVLGDFFFQTPDALASIITGQSKASIVTILDSQTDVFASINKKILDSDGWVVYIVAAIVYLASTLYLAFSGFLIVMAKIALSLILGVGPLFIFFLIFDSSKKMFEAWLQQLINFVFVLTLTIALLSLTTTMIDEHAAFLMNEKNISWGDTIPLVITLIVVFMLLKQLPQIASSLSNGMSLSSIGWAETGAGKAGMVGRGADRAATAGAKALLKRRRRNKIKNATP